LPVGRWKEKEGVRLARSPTKVKGKVKTGGTDQHEAFLIISGN